MPYWHVKKGERPNMTSTLMSFKLASPISEAKTPDYDIYTHTYPNGVGILDKVWGHRFGCGGCWFWCIYNIRYTVCCILCIIYCILYTLYYKSSTIYYIISALVIGVAHSLSKWIVITRRQGQGSADFNCFFLPLIIIRNPWHQIVATIMTVTKNSWRRRSACMYWRITVRWKQATYLLRSRITRSCIAVALPVASVPIVRCSGTFRGAIIHTYVHTYIHIYIHAYIQTYIHIYIYIYMCLCQIVYRRVATTGAVAVFVVGVLMARFYDSS